MGTADRSCKKCYEIKPRLMAMATASERVAACSWWQALSMVRLTAFAVVPRMGAISLLV